MNFPLQTNIKYKTNLNPDVITKRLLKISSGPTKSYEGQIDKLTFDIKRIINYRNSLLPKITGNIRAESDGTIIDVDMRPNRILTIFIGIWFGCVGLLGFLFLPNPMALFPLVLLIFGVFMTIYFFKKETNKSKKDLQTLFEAEIIDLTQI